MVVAAAASRQHVQALRLAVLASNDRARRLYARLGFVETDTAAGAAYVQMRKELAG
jgi:ribosomal protein S18 acetylase RimI-like enzyme